MMPPTSVLAVALVSSLLSGCIADSSAPALPSQPHDEGTDVLPVGRADWTGHVLTSWTDIMMHVYPTEGILWSEEQAGVVVEIPDGVSAIEVAVAWEGSGRFGIHLHSYNKSGEYVGHRSPSEQWSENPHCIRVPADDVASGHWMVMIHSRDALQADFTMSVLTQGATPVVMADERHGHNLAQEWMDGRTREDHEPEACVLWAPEGGHSHGG